MPASFRVFEEVEISEVATLDPASLAIVEHAFSALARGRVIMPAPLGLHIKDDGVEGEVHIKTAYTRGSKGFAVKVATGYYQNARLGLPTSSGMILYLDSQTGHVLALFADNGYLTDLRTALAGAVAAKHLAPTRITTVGIVGTGIQARWQFASASVGTRDPASSCVWPKRDCDRSVHQGYADHCFRRHSTSQHRFRNSAAERPGCDDHAIPGGAHQGAGLASGTAYHRHGFGWTRQKRTRKRCPRESGRGRL